MPNHDSGVRDLMVSTKLRAVLQEHKSVVVLRDTSTVEQALAVRAASARGRGRPRDTAPRCATRRPAEPQAGGR